MHGSRWGSLKLGVVAVIALLMIVLIAQNTTPVEARLLFVTLSMPIAALLLMALLAGLVLGLALASRVLPLPPRSGRQSGRGGAQDADVQAREPEPTRGARTRG